jgi:hypothetical protein
MMRTSMKKVSRMIVLMAALIMLGYVMNACKSTQDCSAYGEVKKYQKEVRP